VKGPRTSAADRYELDDDGMRMVGLRSGDAISLGDRMEIVIEDVAILRRTVYGRRIVVEEHAGAGKAAKGRFGKDQRSSQGGKSAKSGKPAKGAAPAPLGSPAPWQGGQKSRSAHGTQFSYRSQEGFEKKGASKGRAKRR